MISIPSSVHEAFVIGFHNALLLIILEITMQLAHTLPNVANELNLPFLSEGVVEAPSAETFFYSIDTTLKHSNATQNVYFSNYFEWQGY